MARRSGARGSAGSPGWVRSRRGTIAERLTEFDAEGRRLEYVAVAGMPRFVRRAVNRWSVHPATGGCLVRVHATVTLAGRARPLGPLLVLRLRGEARRVLEDLRYRVETGRPRPHPHKTVGADRPSPRDESA